MIRAGDRLSAVIERDGSLIDVLAATLPAFERLRSPALRRVMARLVTVEQAAKMAGVDPAVLVGRLNRTKEESNIMAANDTHETAATAPRPAELERIPAERTVTIDVRAALRAGEEPFSRIMAARRDVPADGALCVRAIFEPVPLYAVMARQGFAHWTEALAADDWRVWFYPERPLTAPTVPPSAVTPSGAEGHEGAAVPADPATSAPDDGIVVLDVRGLEPPEPMVRTLAALEQLPQADTLVQLNERTPQFLLPILEERGFTYEVREQEPGLVRVFIRRRRDH